MVRVNVGEEEKVQSEAADQEAQDERFESDKPVDAPDTADQEIQDVPLEDMSRSQLIDKVKREQETARENFDLYLRSQAEMENLKKRFQRDKADLTKFANETLIKELLPVIDSLEKAVAHSTDEHSFVALKEGVELTLKSLKSVLEKAGVEEVSALHEPFDPNVHEAMLQQEDDTVEPGTVVDEVQRGYMLNKRLIRPAMVVVSKASS